MNPYFELHLKGALPEEHYTTLGGDEFELEPEKEEEVPLEELYECDWQGIPDLTKPKKPVRQYRPHRNYEEYREYRPRRFVRWEQPHQRPDYLPGRLPGAIYYRDVRYPAAEDPAASSRHSYDDWYPLANQKRDGWRNRAPAQYDMYGKRVASRRTSYDDWTPLEDGRYEEYVYDGSGYYDNHRLNIQAGTAPGRYNWTKNRDYRTEEHRYNGKGYYNTGAGGVDQGGYYNPMYSYRHWSPNSANTLF